MSLSVCYLEIPFEAPRCEIQASFEYRVFLVYNVVAVLKMARNKYGSC